MHIFGGTRVKKRYKVRSLNLSNTGQLKQEDYYKLITQTTIKHFINECLYESINYANSNNRKYAKVVEIGGSGKILKLEKDKWKPALEKMLPEYAALEEYDLCISIRDLINELK